MVTSLLLCCLADDSLDYRLIHPSAFAPIEFWSNLNHPSIVSVKEAFTTRSFDDNCSCLSMFSR